MNKKGQILNLIILIFAVIALFTLFQGAQYKYQGKSSGETRIMPGFGASAILNSYQDQEEGLLYLDYLADITLKKALVELDELGGLKESTCGTPGYNLWNLDADKDNFCLPDYESNLSAIFSEGFEDKAKGFNKFTIFTGEDFTLQITNSEIQIVGKSSTQTSLSAKMSVGGAECQTPITGKPSIKVAQIKEVLQKYKSPAKDHAQRFYDKGVETNIDPVFALAFFRQESSFGTAGIAVQTNSVGNIRVKGCEAEKTACEAKAKKENLGQECPICPDNQECDYIYCSPTISCFCGYGPGVGGGGDWDTSIDHWFDLLKNSGNYIAGGKDTLETIIPTYAPSEDSNDPDAYIENVKNFARQYKEIPCKTFLGTMKFRPGFKTAIKYDLTVYDKLKEFAKETIQDCNDNVAFCLEEKKKEFTQANPEIKLLNMSECEEGEEKFYFEFVESFQDCAYSWGDECKCEITNNYTQSEMITFKNDYQINFDKNSDNNYTINIVKPINKNSNLITIDKNLWIPSIFLFKVAQWELIGGQWSGGEYKLRGPILTFKENTNSIKTHDFKFEKLFLVNTNGQQHIMVEKNKKLIDPYKQEIDIPVNNCTIPKLTFQLCAITNNIIPKLKENYKTNEKELVYEKSKIKFALNLNDTVPPASVSDFKAENQIIGGVVLNWHQEFVPDLIMFNVTYQEQGNPQTLVQLGKYYLKDALTNTPLIKDELTLYMQTFVDDSSNFTLKIPHSNLIFWDENKTYDFQVESIDNFQNTNGGEIKSIEK